MINNIKEWQSNPIEATRLCFKYLYEINRTQQKCIESLDKIKASKNELTTGLSTKGDLADIMHTFNEVAQNMEQRPTKDEILIILDEKIGKSDLNKILLNRPSMATVDDIKKLLASGEIKINLKKNFDEENYEVNDENLSNITKLNLEAKINDNNKFYFSSNGFNKFYDENNNILLSFFDDEFHSHIINLNSYSHEIYSFE
jgi:hypothetical protein